MVQNSKYHGGLFCISSLSDEETVLYTIKKKRKKKKVRTPNPISWQFFKNPSVARHPSDLDICGFLKE